MPRKKPSPESPAESSGVVEAESVPVETGKTESSPAPSEPTQSTSEDSEAIISSSDDAPVMARLRQKAEEEAQDGTGAAKGPHPYSYQINAPGSVPDAYRDKAYEIDTALIDDHLQRCHDIGTTPQIPGLLIGRKV